MKVAKARKSSRKSCTCPQCVSCCERKPGWMKPGEAERIAEFLGISLADLFRDYLAVDWWVDARNVFLLSPAIVGEQTGTEMPCVAKGRCVFLTDKGRCQIHSVKPFECGVAWCGDGAVESKGSAHEKAADAWRDTAHQEQIVQLLGREPTTASGSIFDFLRMF